MGEGARHADQVQDEPRGDGGGLPGRPRHAGVQYNLESEYDEGGRLGGTSGRVLLLIHSIIIHYTLYTWILKDYDFATILPLNSLVHNP